MANEHLCKKDVQFKGEGSPVLEERKEVTNSGAIIRGFSDLLPLGEDLFI